MVQTYHLYANVNDFKAYLAGTDHVTDWDTDVAPITRVINAASQRIDNYMGRSFGVRTETHTYDIGRGALRTDALTPSGNEIIDFPDYWSSKLSGAGIIRLADWLVSATTVTAYTGTARGASATLSEGISNDFLLEPYNTSPKTLIKLQEETTKSFDAGQQTLTILGEWGWQNDKSSISTGANFENLRYEGFGPEKIAVIVETLTDNKNRTASNIRTIFQKSGGSFGTTGSASHNFKQIGIIKLDNSEITEDKIFDLAIESGANECFFRNNFYEIHCDKNKIYQVKKKIEKKIKNFISTEIEWVPLNYIEIPEKIKDDISKFLELIEEDEDVQNVFTNVKF